jgi:hypothetical protein
VSAIFILLSLYSLATSDFIGVEKLLNREDDTFQDLFKDDMLDISMSAEGYPITLTVHCGNSFGLNALNCFNPLSCMVQYLTLFCLPTTLKRLESMDMRFQNSRIATLILPAGTEECW